MFPFDESQCKTVVTYVNLHPNLSVYNNVVIILSYFFFRKYFYMFNSLHCVGAYLKTNPFTRTILLYRVVSCDKSVCVVTMIEPDAGPRFVLTL